MPEARFETDSPARTIAFGAWLGGKASAGWVIGLSGDLGAGKTTLVKGVAEGLGVERDAVTSPTFTFLHVYQARIPIYHLDLYRLENAEQVRDLGIEEFIGGDGLALVEWFENVPDVLPAPRLEIVLEVLDAERRRIVVKGVGSGWGPLMEEMARDSRWHS